MENYSGTTSLKMNHNIPQKTAEIFTDIVRIVYLYFGEIKNPTTREKYLVHFVGQSIFNLYSILKSTKTSELAKEKSKRIILNMPRTKNVSYKNFSKFEVAKHLYYSTLAILPYKARLNLVLYINFQFYKLKGY